MTYQVSYDRACSFRPGRLRIRLKQMRNDPRAAADARTAALEIPAVTSAAANTVTGSLVILYDPVRLSSAELWQEVQRRLGPAVDPFPRAAVAADAGAELPREWIDGATKAAIEALIGTLVERSAAALVRTII
jgi:hypothetical protein